MNPSHLTLQQILEIENAPEFAETLCCYTGIPIWTAIRVRLILQIVRDRVYQQPNVQAPTVRRKPLGNVVRSCWHNAKTVPRLWARKSDGPRITILSHGIGNFQDGDRWVNRLSDYFWSAFPESTTVVEDLSPLGLPHPRWNPEVLYSFWESHVLGSWARLTSWRANEEAAIKLLRFALNRADEILGWRPASPQAFRELQIHSLAQLRGYPMDYQFYRALFRALGSEIVILLAGCYGYRAPRVAAAHSLGLPVAEFQHGNISAGHHSYNVSEALAQSSAYARVWPDYFLSYGSWWQEQISIPVTKVPIGNPHFEEVRKKCSAATQPQGSKILLLSNLNNVEQLQELARYLAQTTDFPQFMIRPHPRIAAQVPDHLEDSPRITIDKGSHLYQSFEQCYAVISESSTGLFEAIPFVQKVLAWRTPISQYALGDSVFSGFSSFEECREKLLEPDPEPAAREALLASIWPSGWEENYRRFVRQVV